MYEVIYRLCSQCQELRAHISTKDRIYCAVCGKGAGECFNFKRS